MKYYQLFYKIYQRAAEKMCRECQGFIEKGVKILDLGCGSAIAGRIFQDFFKAEILGIDIVDKRVEKIPFRIYDGKNIPFPEKSFDVILINYVLHHVENQKTLLIEAKRVAKDKIIIFEDLSEGFFSKIYCKFHGLTFKKFFQKDSFISFKTSKEWEEIFQRIGLKIIFKKRISNFPVEKELFILGM